MKNITHIFFDLDHTLWDHELNAQKVLLDLYREFDLASRMTLDASSFLKVYHSINNQLWDDYSHGRINRDYLRTQRFKLILDKCASNNSEDCNELSEYFLEHCPRQKTIIDGADMVLGYLEKKYHLSIVTNGFEDIQHIKLKASGLDKFFSHVFTSETTGKKKPHPAIFTHAMEVLQVTPDRVLMIGDNLKADVGGAINARITPVFYNPNGRIKSDCQWQISHLTELMKLL